jgi:hypothetical protein
MTTLEEAEAHLKSLVGNDPEDQDEIHATMLEGFADEQACIDALIEPIMWQIAKDSGMPAPTAETRQIAERIAVRQVRSWDERS